MSRADLVSAAGLVVFVASVVGSFAAIAFDLCRELDGMRTITQWATRHPARACGVVGLTLIGPAGLAVHFLFFRR